MVSTRGPKYNKRRGSGNIAIAVDIDFQWYGERVEAAVDSALIQAINWAIEEALALVHLPGWTPYVTGDLLASIINLGIRHTKYQVIGAFGSPLHYALFQELGTVKIAPKFYLTRAGNLVAVELEKWIREALTARGYGPR